nr:hypothetical protein [Tanacetum cinerariifolium]
FPLPVIEFPLAEEVPTAGEEGCHCQRDATARKIALLSMSRRNCQSKMAVTLSKIPVLDTGTFEQWQFRIQQYLQHEHYALWETFGGNKATKKTKKNLLKQQYGNFKAEGSKTLEQTFNRLSDLDTMSLDDLYNHLKVYESEVQKKPEQNSQNMAFISSVKHISRNEDGNTASVPTASTNVPTASASVATISQDTAAYIASQSSSSQIKFEDINQIDEDDMEEMDIKWNMALPSIRADKFWKKTGKKISIQGSDIAGFDKSKEEVPTAGEEGCHCQRDATARKIALLSMSRRNCQSKMAVTLSLRLLVILVQTVHSSAKTQFRRVFVISQGESLSIYITFSSHSHQEMDQQYPTVAKIPILDTGKFEQWQFRIQQYLQHEHYALWEVIKFGDSYVVPVSTTTTDTTSGEIGKKPGRTVTLNTEDMQKKKNDVKARTTLLLFLPDEHQLRFSKYKTAQELWAAILKTFGGNEATKKTKKNLLKQQYGNFKAEGIETMEKTFNRLQVIVGQLQFMDVEIEQDDLNQKFLTSLAPEWRMHTIVWRNRSDLDTMSLDDLYNHLKVYESEVQKTLEPNSQNMAFISSAKHSSGNEDSNTASFSTTSTNVPTASANERGRRDNYRHGSKVEEQAPKALMEIDGVGWDWSYMENDGEDHALVADEEGPTEFALMANTSTESKDLSWTGLPKCTDDTVTDYSRDSPTMESTSECADDTVTDYSRPSPTSESILEDDQNRNTSVSEIVASRITSKPFIKFVRPKDSQSDSKTDKKETPKKLPVKYAEQYKKSNMKPKARGNQRNWNKLKSQQLAHLYTNRPVHRTSAVRSPSRAPWVPTVNRNYSPINRKFSTRSRNFPTANRKFPTASRKFPTGSTKSITADMGLKRKAVKPSACWFWRPSQNLSNKAFCDYHNMIAILEKYEQNVNFHPIVDFVEASYIRYALTFNPTVYISHIRQFWSTARIETMEEGTKILATIDGNLRTVTESSIRRNLKLYDEEGINFVGASHIRYALTFNPTIYVSHIRQFWSTARIETTDEGTKILATVDGILRTVIESSIRRNLKLNDEEGLSSLPDTELFENLTLMGYNISPNKKFTFQKGQFSHQWKYLIYTIMQCLSPKSTGFNEFSSNIATALVSTFLEMMPQSRGSLDEKEVATEMLSNDTEEIRLDEGEVAVERVSDDTEDMATVLTTIDATSVLSSGEVQVVPTAAAVAPANVSIPTDSGVVPTASPTISTATPIFSTATTVTPYTRRKGKEKMEETDTPKKKKRLQEQIDV